LQEVGVKGEAEFIRILLIAEERLVCAALKALVTSWRAFHVIGEAATSDEAVAQLRRDTPDVILLSLAGSDEVDRKLVSDMVQVCGPARLVVLVNGCDEEFRSDLVRFGATAVVSRTAHPSALQKAIAENRVRHERP
jgi:DNA-binding NarL/FixJ family response regulator